MQPPPYTPAQPPAPPLFGQPAGQPTVPTADGYWVYGRGCTEPGGGIVPGWGFVPRIWYNPPVDRHRVVGFGQEEILAPVAAAPSPWAVALVTSMLGATTGWLIEEVARSVRGKRKRR